MSQQTTIAVLGDGGWGTALSILLHNKGHHVRLWSPFPEYAEVLNEKRENVKYLPGIPIPEDLFITSDIAESFAAAEVVIFVTPSHHLREVCVRAKPFIRPEAIRLTAENAEDAEAGSGSGEAVREGRLSATSVVAKGAGRQTLVSATKGLEEDTLLRMSQVIEEVLGHVGVAVLSGPTLAREVATGHPTAATVSSRCPSVARAVQSLLTAQHFRLYTSPDIIGVELGGALKNVIAIAAGIIDGLGLGANTKSALLTRGLAEMARLGVAMGADRSTFFGLSGLGDLFTTAVSDLSRNHTFGCQVGRGVPVKEAQSSTEMVIEGIRTANAAVQLALRHNVEMPIATEVYHVLYKGKHPRDAIATLMARPPKPELGEELE
ncbi:MAG: NAD(P)H-dependent glycerol-3-phosphate dehydrogenase [bacterium]|nr:NAD(P)H-dependent glycerol-3-phosphate dehydrogenase [bacterium]